MNKTLYVVYQGTLYELDYTLDNGKYRLDPDNILCKRVFLEAQLNVVHGKKFNAYVVGFDVDKVIDIYSRYMKGCVERLKEELDVLERFCDIF